MNDFERSVIDRCFEYNKIFIFVSKEDEVNTHNIIKKLIGIGKKVYVPVCTRIKEMQCCRLNNFDELELGKFGILEPKNKCYISKHHIDIFFVPGTRFDCSGNRQGRGCGYFDIFLEDIKGKKPIIGLGYENQVAEKIEPNPWDIPVDEIINQSLPE